MPQDYFTLTRAVAELNTFTVGAKINKINVPTDFETVFTVYNGKTFKLIISANAKYARVGITKAEKKNPIVAQNFCMLLRKHLTGAKIKNIELVNDDRIVKISFENENDLKERVNLELFAEIMGKYSNVFLTKNGLILGSLRTAPQNLESARITLTGSKYVYPSRPEKTNPYNVAEAKRVFSLYSGGDLSRFILNNFHGFSPVTADEISHLITLNGEFSVDGAVSVLNDFVHKKSAPVIIKNGNKSDFYAFDYTHILGERIYFNCLTEAVNEWATAEENNAEFLSLKNAAISKVTAYENKQLKHLALTEDKITEAGGIEKTKLYAELITSNIYNLKKGMEKARLLNYYSENETYVEIPLDKNLSPNENAQKYYKKYAKLKKAVSVLTPRKNEILSELDYVKNLKFEISSATDIDTLNGINAELISYGISHASNNQNNKKQTEPSLFRVYKVQEFTVKVGKNNVQNDILTGNAKRYDIWLHTKNYHSCHVIIETENKPVSDGVILTAAEICAYFSEAKSGDKIPVDYTLKKFVKKPPKAKPGSVIYTDFKTLFVTPCEHKNLLN